MALIAAASINIDLAMFVGFVLIVLLILALWYLCKLARLAVRRLSGNDDSSEAPRRTRVRRVETELADLLQREYPNSKPAQFI